MKALVVYKSKTGFSQRYAEALAEKLGTAAINVKDVKNADIEGCDTVVWCAGVYASRVSGIGKLRQWAAKHDGKRFFVLAVGGTNDENGFYREELERANLPGGSVRLFYARGGFDEDRMNLFDRWVIRMMRKALSEKEDPTDEDKRLLETVNSREFVLDENIINEVKEALIAG